MIYEVENLQMRKDNVELRWAGKVDLRLVCSMSIDLKDPECKISICPNNPDASSDQFLKDEASLELFL